LRLTQITCGDCATDAMRASNFPSETGNARKGYSVALKAKRRAMRVLIWVMRQN
jgi:hypothetical protein